MRAGAPLVHARVAQFAFAVLACVPGFAAGVSSTSTFVAIPSLTPPPDVFGRDAVYCAFVSNERGKIVAAQKTDNVGFGLDDYAAVMFDTSGNGTNQYFFETTPAGVRYQQASESSRYAPPWTAFAAVDGRRWLAEFVIPYRFLRGSSRTWRVNFVRNVANSQQLYSWAFEAQMSGPFAESFRPSLRNAPALKTTVAKPTVQVYGLLSAGGDRRVFEGAAAQFAANAARDAGVDAKIPLTSSLNFDGTLDPDFSGVENDQQVIAPQEFRYQYADYRPFFTQGANDLPGNEVFYSPSIGVFDRGEKLEGQVAKLNVGILDVGAFGSSQPGNVGEHRRRAGRPFDGNRHGRRTQRRRYRPRVANFVRGSRRTICSRPTARSRIDSARATRAKSIIKACSNASSSERETVRCSSASRCSERCRATKRSASPIEASWGRAASRRPVVTWRSRTFIRPWHGFVAALALLAIAAMFFMTLGSRPSRHPTVSHVSTVRNAR